MSSRNWIKKLTSHQKKYLDLIDKPYIGLTEVEMHMRKNLLHVKRHYDEKKRNRIMGKQKINNMIETETNVIDNSKMTPFTKSKHYRKLASKLYYKKSFEKGLHFHRLCIHNMELCYGNTHPNVLHETSIYIKRLEEGSRINNARKALKSINEKNI